jgi:hypothetical protein
MTLSETDLKTAMEQQDLNYSKHLHHFITEMIDDLYRDSP